MHVKEVKSLKLLLNLTYILNISPRYATKMNNKKPRYRPVFTVILFIAGCIFSQNSKMRYFKFATKKIHFVLDFISEALYCVFIGVMVLGPAINHTLWKELFSLLTDYSHHMEKLNIPIQISGQLMWCRIILIHVLNFAFAFYALYWYVSHNVTVEIIYQIYRYSVDYMSLASLLLVITFLMMIKQRVKCLNVFIKRCILAKKENMALKSASEVGVLEIQTIFRKLCDFIGYFNTIFGYHLLFFLATRTLSLLRVFNTCLSLEWHLYTVMGNAFAALINFVSKYFHYTCIVTYYFYPTHITSLMFSI